MATSTVGNGNGNGQMKRNGRQGLTVSVGWPTERWVGLIVVAALATLILIRFGFRGVGISGNVGGRVSL